MKQSLNKIGMKWGFLLVFLLISPCLFPQDAIVLLKFEDAEKAYNNGEYQQTLKHLDEVEQKAGVTSKTLYLKILAQDKLYKMQEAYNEGGFHALSALRQHTAAYLEIMAKQGLDERYREVYRISESLNSEPKSRQEWEKQKEAYLEGIEKKKLLKAQQNALEEKRLLDEEYERIYNGAQSIRNMQYHRAATRLASENAEAAKVFFIRPESGTKSMRQSLIVNEELLTEKFDPGEYATYFFTPGLLKLGDTGMQNRKKVKVGNALLMGGVIGLAATSGKIVAKNQAPFLLELQPSKTYFFTSVITKEKTIVYKSISEPEAKSLIKQYKPIN